MEDNKAIEKAGLNKKVFFEGKIKTLTGLHIGGSNTGLDIGGVDAQVVRNPFDNEPYIPGSSLKGKMRSLLERLEKKIGTKSMGAVKFGPYQELSDRSTLIPRIFGVAPDDNTDIKEPVSRLIVRDCYLTPDSSKRLKNLVNADIPFTEVKTEVVIDRITARAMPRQLERVPAGAEFKMQIVLNIHEMDKAQEADFVSKVFEALCLVQDDYLGGKGTRGSGQVKIIVKELKQKTLEDYETNTTAQTYSGGLEIPDELKE